MATEETLVIPEPQTLPEDPCVENLQQLLNLFSAHQRVRIPLGLTQILSQPTKPGPEDQDKIWLKTHPTSGHGLGFYVYDSAIGDFSRVDGEPIYFVDTGSANAMIVSTGEGWGDLAYLVGRPLVIKVAATSTATAVTLQVDSTAATPVKDAQGDTLAIGALRSSMLLWMIFDGAVFRAINPLAAPSEAAGTFSYPFSLTISEAGILTAVTAGLFEDTAPIPADGESVSFEHDLDRVPAFVQVRCVMGSTTEHGYAHGDEMDAMAVVSLHTDNESAAFVVTVNGTHVVVALRPNSGLKIGHKTGAGTYLAMTKSLWTLKVRAY